MAMFKMEPSWAGYPQSVTVAGSVTLPNATAASGLTPISQANLLVGSGPQGAQLGPQNQMTPYSPKVTAVLNPTTAYKPTVAPNAGVPTVLLLDFSGFNANLVSLQVQLRLSTGAANGNISFGAQEAVLFDYDQTNKLAYVGVMNASGTPQALISTMTLMFNATFIDSAFP